MIIGYALMPMVANARVRYAYESSVVRKPEIEMKKDDENDSPVKINKKSGATNRKTKGKIAEAEVVQDLQRQRAAPLEIDNSKVRKDTP